MIEIEIPNSRDEIPEFNYSNWNMECSSFEHGKLQFIDFFSNFMIKNLPCLIRNVASDWECARKWVKDNEINYAHISEIYGDLDAPVADCGNSNFNSHQKIEMKVSEYMDYMKCEKDKILYLKDWHLKRKRPDDIFYTVPSFFGLDWLNEFAVDTKEDDFMFVYIGPEKSWTPLHEDVYCSYSWSVNIVGKKKWILFPPGEENKLKDPFGNLPLTFNPDKHDNIKYFEIVQEKGDAIFVPSGWHHQVLNEMDTISINHNWINACNIHIVWEALKKSLQMVENQIEDFKDTDEFPVQCQLILKAIFGMDFNEFLRFLCHIAKKRLTQLQGESRVGFNNYLLGNNIIRFELRHILKVMNSIILHPILLKNPAAPTIEDFIKVKTIISDTFNWSQQ